LPFVQGSAVCDVTNVSIYAYNASEARGADYVISSYYSPSLQTGRRNVYKMAPQLATAPPRLGTELVPAKQCPHILHQAGNVLLVNGALRKSSL
jgi:hypothetical protein